MKLLLSTFLCLFTLCSFAQITTNSQWTWMKGDNTTDELGVYGTQGVSAPTNKPSARYGSVSWVDGSGNFWLFGGYGQPGGYLNDLWKYNPLNNQWTWVKGDIANGYGIYGTQGIPDPANNPGSRESSISWIDSNGKLWLFGGDGLDESGADGYLNDLWKYDPLINQWTWVNGDNTIDQNGIYGTQGVSGALNSPGGRGSSVSWIDGSGNLWLFGGYGLPAPATGIAYFLNDLWKYNPSTNRWTWMKGNNTTNQYGVYGSKGVAATANKPGARDGSLSWIDGSGNLWLFGGDGFAVNNITQSRLNDLWKYNPSINQWAWISGDNTVDQAGIYGTQGISGASNKPGGRMQGISWKDVGGNFWLFGGEAWTSSGYEDFNDLWKYDLITNQWTWVKGNNLGNQGGTYGTQGIAADNNTPGSRFNAGVSWLDNKGNFWFFGGYGEAINPYFGTLNDLWKLDKDGFVWIGVSNIDWTVGSNWSGGVAPGINNIVTIPAGTPYSPIVLNGKIGNCKDITIQAGATLTIEPTGTLNISH
jgi:N-acetylneuraminic acid mutarotase